MDARRRGLLQAGVSLAALAALPATPAMPLLRETHPDALTLSYAADASLLDASPPPGFVPGSRCADCFFFQGRNRKGDAPCTVFAGWRVSAKGWCQEYKPRAG